MRQFPFLIQLKKLLITIFFPSPLPFPIENLCFFSLVNDLLHEVPDFPEALFLKAQILWEGFGKAAAAIGWLSRIRELTPADNTFHRWASSSLEKIAGMEEKYQTRSGD